MRQESQISVNSANLFHGGGVPILPWKHATNKTYPKMKTFSTKQDCDLKSYIDLKTYSMEFLDYCSCPSHKENNKCQIQDRLTCVHLKREETQITNQHSDQNNLIQLHGDYPLLGLQHRLHPKLSTEIFIYIIINIYLCVCIHILYTQ